MKRQRWYKLSSLLVIALLVAACGGDTDAPTDAVADDAGEEDPDSEVDAADTDDEDPTGADDADDGEVDSDIELLGGEEAAAEMERLYRAALDAGETDVVVYGPGEDDKAPVYDLFMDRFDGISVRGEYLVGPNMDSKINAEFASGVHVASVMQSGDTSLAPKIPTDDDEGQLQAFTPVTAEDLDPQFHDEAGEYAFAASASTFGILYNPDMLQGDDVPTSWDDLLDPEMSGKLVWDDPTRFGAAFGFLNKILSDDRYDESFVEGLRANEVYLEGSQPSIGNAVATSQFPASVAYVYSYYLRDLERGAPVDFVFPVEGGNHLSPHYLGLLRNAPSPDAGKLLITWLLSPEGQTATAEAGYYPTRPGIPGPEGSPPVEDLDLLDPIPLSEVNRVSVENLEIVQNIWGETGD